MKGKRVKGKFSKGKKSSHWRNPSGFAHIAAQEWGDDVAYNADMAEDDPYSDPAHWYEDYDEEADAYYAEDQETPHTADNEWAEFSAFVADEWAQKRDIQDS